MHQFINIVPWRAGCAYSVLGTSVKFDVKELVNLNAAVVKIKITFLNTVQENENTCYVWFLKEKYPMRTLNCLQLQWWLDGILSLSLFYIEKHLCDIIDYVIRRTDFCQQHSCQFYEITDKWWNNVISTEVTFIKEHAKDLVAYVIEQAGSSYFTFPTLHSELRKKMTNFEVEAEGNFKMCKCLGMLEQLWKTLHH